MPSSEGATLPYLISGAHFRNDYDQEVPISKILLDQGLGYLPAGSKALVSQNQSYVIAPLGEILDERYTGYFQFQGSPWAQAEPEPDL